MLLKIQATRILGEFGEELWQIGATIANWGNWYYKMEQLLKIWANFIAN